MKSRVAEFWTKSDLPIEIGAETGGSTSREDNHAQDWAFGLSAPDFQLYTNGLDQKLEPGTADSLGDRVRNFFAERHLSPSKETKAKPRLLVGALPFDRQATDCLFLPKTVSNRAWKQPQAGQQPQVHTLEPQPSRAAYEAAVSAALSAIEASKDSEDPLAKVVLSRSLLLKAETAFDPRALWRDLKADAHAVRFMTPLGAVPEQGGAMRYLTGATPELLVSKRGPLVLSHPLAGSARRSTDLSVDEASAQALLTSDKDLREHALVVEAILDLLAPYCRDLRAPQQPALVSTQTMWHLGTRIEGVLQDPEAVNAAELAALLHPTPAVCGASRTRAYDLIQDLEGYDRGFYAGAVGWTNGFGDGAWYVSLRCAETCGSEARLYAGAGIVAGSSPAAEADETSGKFQAVLRALGVNEASL